MGSSPSLLDREAKKDNSLWKMIKIIIKRKIRASQQPQDTHARYELNKQITCTMNKCM